jgi:PadR family transcriptional regulator
VPRLPDASPQTLMVLRALLEVPDAWQHGYDLSRRLRLRSGTLYPILVRLADRGCLETRWVEPDRPGRPPRHTYRLTTEGRELARSRLAATQPATTQPAAAPTPVSPSLHRPATGGTAT